MTDFEELFTYAPPRDPPPPPVDWAATRAALGVDLPDDYKALVEAYDSALGMLVGLLSGRLTSEFLVIEGEGFEPYG